MKDKPDAEMTCYYCGKVGHRKADCWGWQAAQKEKEKEKPATKEATPKKTAKKEVAAVDVGSLEVGPLSACASDSWILSDGLQLIQILGGLCILGNNVFQDFRSSSHVSHVEVHAWDKDFVNVSDRFPPARTVSTFKRPSCTACCSHKKRMSTCRVFPCPCRADTPLAALLSQRM